jgi:hypothetical protein
MRKIIVGMLTLVSLASQADVVDVEPISYTFDQSTGEGLYTYEDWTGRQLIDGNIGGNRWSDDVGNGNAYEWVGWVTKDVNIDFSFIGNVIFDSVTVQSTQDSINNVVLPSVRVFGFNESQWYELDYLFTPESSANNTGRKALSLNNLGGYTGNKLRISLERSVDGPWTFTDEITFRGTVNQQMFNVNSPAVLSALGMIGMIGLLGLRRKKKA